MNYLLVYLKGIAMGAADVVPGVSGGTIAFISGIYETLIQSLRSFDLKAAQYLLKFDLQRFWQHINGTFLVSLLAGIGTSILLLSKLVLYLLDTYPILVWSFFFGLILASIVLVGKTIQKVNFMVILMGIIGIIIAYITTVAAQIQTPDALWFIFLSGMIAICAMILPGISGSFLLVILGKYEYILSSLTERNFPVIIVFSLGCVIGLLAFSHFLNWLFEKYHNQAIALLTGFMIGAMNKVWAWKNVLQTYTDRHGKVKPLVTENVLPADYELLTGQDSFLIPAIVMTVVGFLLVYGLDRFANSKTLV